MLHLLKFAFLGVIFSSSVWEATGGTTKFRKNYVFEDVHCHRYTCSGKMTKDGFSADLRITYGSVGHTDILIEIKERGIPCSVILTFGNWYGQSCHLFTFYVGMYKYGRKEGNKIAMMYPVILTKRDGTQLIPPLMFENGNLRILNDTTKWTANEETRTYWVDSSERSFTNVYLTIN